MLVFQKIAKKYVSFSFSRYCSLLKIACNVKSRAAAALGAVPPAGVRYLEKNNNANGPITIIYYYHDVTGSTMFTMQICPKVL